MAQEEQVRTLAVERFQNVPPIDFSQAEMQREMQQALEDVSQQFGRDYPLVINAKFVDTRAHLNSRNPSQKEQILGKVSSASADHVQQAVEAAYRAWTQWRKVPSAHRAEYLELMAREMQGRRFELAAWIIYECGKPWKDADAEVAEAIDFCLYYARCMRELDHVLTCDYRGEQNRNSYRSRGVTVVIAPWNFPLAILTGMTAAALVTGNTVVMKPAEQSSVVAAKLMEIARDAGLPPGVLNYLPGNGEDIGPLLVDHPQVEMIAFTGSREVGLEINRRAAAIGSEQLGIKKVIAKLGGKNAIIVDEDADLDEAVQGCVESAFGYAGQKCSAASRIITLTSVHDAFVERFRAACESLRVGPADDPGVDFGPLIDEAAFERVKDYIAIGNEECTPLVAMETKKLSKSGWFVGPHVFTNVEPDSRLAQDEIFGPVVSVLTARNLDQAFQFANSTAYALTGGIYSRSPLNLQRAREEFLVGNLYLNRTITGALVQRHPFGGFKMSGIGTKAGGPDYLLQFLLPVNISENTMRHGFAPDSAD